jgi:ComF family protein
MHPVASAVLDLLLAPACLGCDGTIAPGDPARLVCRRCRVRMRRIPQPACSRCGAPFLQTGRAPEVPCGECRHWPPALRAARSAVLLEPPGDGLVHNLKYRGWRALAAPLGALMAERIELPQDVRAEARLCIPVATTPRRMRERGYNQAALLAAEFAGRTGLELCDVLVRRGATATQTALQPAARGRNVAGAFGTRAGMRRALEGRHVLLVDDVLTTGATAIECTSALLAAGARCVSLISFARALGARRLPEP